jgi:hypothetical protein
MKHIFWIIVGTVIGWFLNQFQKNFYEIIGDLKDGAEELLGKYPAKRAREIVLQYSSSDAIDADKVYVAGSFNRWLNAESGLIIPRKRFALQKEQSSDKVVWRRKIWLSPGRYEFKFVLNKNIWIHWQEGMGYPAGPGAPGGQNCLLIVKE